MLQRFTRTVRQDRRIFGVRIEIIEKFGEVLQEDLKAKIGVGMVAVFILSAIFAPELVPHDPMAQEFAPFTAPDLFSSNPLGTDSYGRDLLSRLMHGARISLGVGLAAVSLASLVGVTIGLIAGYYGGWVDDVLMRFIDWMWAFPYLIVAILFLVLFGQSVLNVILAIAFAQVDDFARLMRGEVLALRDEEYILAAESMGLNDFGIIVGELFPNAIAPIIVEYTVLTARAMISEATLSFLGLGVPITVPTWGSLLGQGRDFMLTAWWISVLPGLAIMLAVLGINLFGDALRDAYDVKET